MRVLVTGANGFLGRKICDELKSQGHTPLAFVRGAIQAEALQTAGIECIVGSLTEPVPLKKILSTVDAVVHAAGGGKASRPESFFENNVRPTQCLVEASKGLPLKRWVLISSLAAAGPSPDGTPLAHNAPTAPMSPYGESKAAAERCVLKEKDSFHVAIIRPPAIYGPGDSRWLPFFRAAQKKWVPLPGGKRKTLSLIHVADCAAAVVRTLEADFPSGTNFFVDDGPPHAITDFIAALERVFGHAIVPIGIPAWLFRPVAHAVYGVAAALGREPLLTPSKVKELLCPHWVCDSAQTQSMLKWRPQISLPAGVEETAHWYQKEGWI